MSSLPLSKRVACVDVPALALQLVLREHPQWASDPVVIVEDDRPRASIVWANRAARVQRIRRGMCFSEAKALSAVLRAEVVPDAAVEAAIDALLSVLLKLSPHIEPMLDQAGLFWVDPSGLVALFGQLERWASAVQAALTAERFVSSVVVGFSRGHTLALARERAGVLVTRDPEAERALAARVLLSKLEIPAALRDQLALLGIHTVGELLALPGSQLKLRYGAQAGRLHDFLSGRSWTPLLPRIPLEPLVLELAVEPPDDDQSRLLFGLKGVLQRALPQLARSQQALTALVLELAIERNGRHSERVETAAPTLDGLQVLDLVRLRLGSLSLPGKVEHVRMTLEHVRVHPRQVALAMQSSDERRPRDLEAAARALSRLRASFGDGAVATAKLRDAHLPEARFAFVPVSEVRLPRCIEPVASRSPVRRVFAAPLQLPSLMSKRNARDEPEAWLGGRGAVKSMLGPDRIAGGWWISPVERDYYVVETSTGELLWVYHDKQRRRWMLHAVLD